jgi:hypothetical protein
MAFLHHGISSQRLATEGYQRGFPEVARVRWLSHNPVSTRCESDRESGRWNYEEAISGHSILWIGSLCGLPT